MFLDLLPSSGENISIFFQIVSCHLMKLLPRKIELYNFSSLCTCLYSCLLFCPIILFCWLIISTSWIWSSRHLCKLSLYRRFSVLQRSVCFFFSLSSALTFFHFLDAIAFVWETVVLFNSCFFILHVFVEEIIHCFPWWNIKLGASKRLYFVDIALLECVLNKYAWFIFFISGEFSQSNDQMFVLVYFWHFLYKTHPFALSYSRL